MTSLQLDLFAEPKTPPTAKPHKRSAWEIERDELFAIRLEIRRELPNDDERLVGRYVTNLAGYDQAVRDGDYERQSEIGNRMDAIAEHVFGFGLDLDAADCWKGNGRFDCLFSAREWLAAASAQKDGYEPAFGQQARFLISVAGCRVDFRYAGMFGICGGSASVIDLDKPFFSETGYRSFQVVPMDHLIFADGLSPRGWLERVCEAQLTEGGKKKVKLAQPPFGLAAFGQQRTDDHIRERRAQDPAYAPGGYLHGAAA